LLPSMDLSFLPIVIISSLVILKALEGIETNTLRHFFTLVFYHLLPRL